MQLIDSLKRRLEAEESYFRQHLIREDIDRLQKLCALMNVQPDATAFVAAALKIGWTPEDRRTDELKPALEPLLLALHETRGADPAVLDQLDPRIAALWQAFEALRMDRLVGCLARVPRPQDSTGA